MISLATDQTKRLLTIHGWSGAVLGLLLYVVVLTGAVAVFAGDIGAWAVSGADHRDPLARWVGVAVSNLAAEIPDAYEEDISIFYDNRGDLRFFFHTHAINPDGDLDGKGVMVTLDTETHAVLSRQEGFGSDLFVADPAEALTRFLVDLHVTLHVPDPLGLYLTGLLGFLMLSAAVSGVLLHRHFIRDQFVAPRLSSRLLQARDRHILAGTWGIAFAVILAFTGAFFSFAAPLGLPVVSVIAFGGDQEAMIETLSGAPEIENPRPAVFVNLDGVLRQSALRAGTQATFVSVEHRGRADARIFVFHRPPEGGFRNIQHVYDGTSGAFLGIKPDLGATASAGDAVFGVMAALHFGTFAGFLSRLIWFGLGLAMAYVTLTGLHLWLRRREDSPRWRRIGRLVPAVGYGLPIALCGSAAGFFLSLGAGTTGFWTPAGFLAAAVAPLALAWRQHDPARLRRHLRLGLGTALAGLPALRLLAGGAGWIDLLSTDNGDVLLMDLALLIAAVGLLYANGRAADPASALPEAAE